MIGGVRTARARGNSRRRKDRPPVRAEYGEELWSLMVNASYLDFEPWPNDPALIAQEKITSFPSEWKRKYGSVDATIDEAAAKKCAHERKSEGRDRRRRAEAYHLRR